MRVRTLVGLWRYPVKSMQAEGLTEAMLVGTVSRGIAGRRSYARVWWSGFPWLTLRERPQMGRLYGRRRVVRRHRRRAGSAAR